MVVQSQLGHPKHLAHLLFLMWTHGPPLAKSVANPNDALLVPKAILQKFQGVPRSSTVMCGKDYVKTHPPNLGKSSFLPM